MPNRVQDEIVTDTDGGTEQTKLQFTHFHVPRFLLIFHRRQPNAVDLAHYYFGSRKCLLYDGVSHSSLRQEKVDFEEH